MHGIQRFFLCGLSLFVIMLCYPHYGHGAGWSFAGTTLLMLAGGLLVLSVLINLFGLDRFDKFNRFLTIVIWVVFTYFMLLHFPQDNKVSVLNKLKNKQYPTREDISLGARHFTFAYDFMPDMNDTPKPPYTRSELPYLDGDPNETPQKAGAAKAGSKTKAAAPKQAAAPAKKADEPVVEIFLEDEEGYVDEQFMPQE